MHPQEYLHRLQALVHGAELLGKIPPDRFAYQPTENIYEIIVAAEETLGPEIVAAARNILVGETYDA